MSVTDTMKWMGRNARHKTEALGHSMKDRATEKRLERASDEADRLRFENEVLRDEVAETRSEHGRILDLLESRLSAPQEETGKRSHKGRWLLFLMAIGGGAYAWMRMRSNGNGDGEAWSGHLNDSPAVTQAGTSTM